VRLSFFVGLVTVELFLPHSDSLKAKRSVLGSVKERLRNLGASVAETDGHDLWQRATLGLAMAGHETARLEKMVQAARDIVDREYRAQVLSFDWEVVPAPWSLE
jgi:uncharacterized protein YlxP (DUF503 family)